MYRAARRDRHRPPSPTRRVWISRWARLDARHALQPAMSPRQRGARRCARAAAGGDAEPGAPRRSCSRCSGHTFAEVLALVDGDKPVPSFCAAGPPEGDHRDRTLAGRVAECRRHPGAAPIRGAADEFVVLVGRIWITSGSAARSTATRFYNGRHGQTRRGVPAAILEGRGVAARCEREAGAVDPVRRRHRRGKKRRARVGATSRPIPRCRSRASWPTSTPNMFPAAVPAEDADGAGGSTSPISAAISARRRRRSGVTVQGQIRSRSATASCAAISTASSKVGHSGAGDEGSATTSTRPRRRSRPSGPRGSAITRRRTI